MPNEVIFPAGELGDMMKAADAALTMTGLKSSLASVIDDAIGVLGGDQLHVFRRRRRYEMWQDAVSKVRAKHREPVTDASFSVLQPILEAGQDETRESVKQMFNELLAAAIDPARKDAVRRDFIEIVKAMEPLDAQILSSMFGLGAFPPNLRDHMTQKLGVSSDAVEVSLFHLIDLRVLRHRSNVEPNPGAVVDAHLTAVGRELLRVLYS